MHVKNFLAQEISAKLNASHIDAANQTFQDRTTAVLKDMHMRRNDSHMEQSRVEGQNSSAK